MLILIEASQKAQTPLLLCPSAQTLHHHDPLASPPPDSPCSPRQLGVALLGRRVGGPLSLGSQLRNLGLWAGAFVSEGKCHAPPWAVQVCAVCGLHRQPSPTPGHAVLAASGPLRPRPPGKAGLSSPPLRVIQSDPRDDKESGETEARSCLARQVAKVPVPKGDNRQEDKTKLTQREKGDSPDGV